MDRDEHNEVADGLSEVAAGEGAPLNGQPRQARARRQPAAGATARKGPKHAEEALKHVPSLIDAFRWGQANRVEEIAGDMVKLLEEADPKLAERMRKRMTGHMKPRSMKPLPEHLLSMRTPVHGLEKVLLAPDVEPDVKRIMDEHARRAELALFGLEPRHKVLLHGPPGNGKTLLAEAIAKEVDVPFLAVKYGGMVESYLGATGKNLQEVFSYAAAGPCVLLMDEVDSVASARNGLQETGEVRRVTNQLLLMMDQLPSSCILVAASNERAMLDAAFMRRFDFEVELKSPDLDLRRRCAVMELDKALTPGFDVSHMAEEVAMVVTKSLHAVSSFCRGMRRDLVLNGGEGIQGMLAEASKVQ